MRPVAVLALTFAVALATHAQNPSIADLKTTPEATGYKSTSTYDDVVKFMKAVDEASPIIFYTTYGTTFEGRAMPLAVVGTGLKDASPAAVKASGKLRVHIQGNVHAGEVEGKEAAQVLLREFAMGQHADWLQSMVFLITPIYNADGNEKFALTNRQRQNGPINGMGTRANAQNLNINRDYMKLDTPEAKAFVKLWVDYDPQVGFDLHTSDGSAHGYYLTYSPPLNPDTSPTIMKIMTDEWFPFVTKNMKAKHGWDSFYYGNASTPGAAAAEGAGWRPRTRSGGRCPASAVSGSSAGSNRHPRMGDVRARAALPQQLRRPAEPLRAAERGLRLRDVRGSHQGDELLPGRGAELRAPERRAPEEGRRRRGSRQNRRCGARDDRPPEAWGMVEILMGEVEDEKNPLNGAVMNRRKDVVKPEQMVDMMWFEPATTETVPRGYYLPPNLTKAVDLLKAHGVQVGEVRGALKESFEGFGITGNTLATSAFEGHTIRKLEGRWGVKLDMPAPTSGWVVYTNQPLGRLAFYLLEPASDDGLVAWNFLDDVLKDATAYPILRIAEK